MSVISRLLSEFVDWVRALFWKQEMELTLVGLQASGKTTLVNLISDGAFSEDQIPTVGFNMKKVTRGNGTAPPLSRLCLLRSSSSSCSDAQVLGRRRAAALSLHVGALLPRRQRHCFRGGCG